jgi:hypothetical protein
LQQILIFKERKDTPEMPGGVAVKKRGGPSGEPFFRPTGPKKFSGVFSLFVYLKLRIAGPRLTPISGLSPASVKKIVRTL